MALQILLAVVTLACMPVVYTQRDASVCSETESDNSGPPLPVLGDVFSVRVEVNVVNKNFTIDVHEWHDGPANRGAATVWYTGLPLSFIYSYSTGELFNIEQLAGGDHHCKVEPLDTLDQPYLHGMDNTSDGHAHIYSTARAFSFGGSLQEHYQGRSTARGITTDVWRACVYWPQMPATMVVDWHFTVREGWDTAVGRSQIPVRCHVTGTTTGDQGGMRSFEHLYEVTEFRPYLDSGSKVFETPAGTVCAGRMNTKPLPVLVDTFSYGAEVLNVEQQYTQYIKKAYDKNLQLAMLEFVSASTPQTTLRLIDDFNTGASFSLDVVHGNCTVATIDPVGFDAIRTTSGLRMRTPHEFFFNVETDYSYEGIRNVRMFNTDVWVGTQQGWPPNDPTNSTWEYYFVTQEWTENSGSTTVGGVPVSIHVSLGRQSAHQIYNIYNFREGDPQIWTYDITSCFDARRQTQMLQFSFQVTPVQLQAVVDNQSMFRRALLTSVTSLVHISPVRLNNINLQFRTNSVVVSLVLVDAVQPVRSVISNPLHEPDLHKAVTQLQAALDGGTFVLHLNTSTAIIKLVARPYSDPTPTPSSTGQRTTTWNPGLLTPSPPQPTPPTPTLRPTQSSGTASQHNNRRVLVCSAQTSGYTPGDVAGVTMGTAFTGYLLVLGGLVVWTRWRGGTVTYQRDRMELS